MKNVMMEIYWIKMAATVFVKLKIILYVKAADALRMKLKLVYL